MRHRRCSSWAQAAIQISSVVSITPLYWLFIQYMYAAVYRLHERGVRLPKPKDPVSGELRLHPHQAGTNDPQALLAELVRDDGGIALPALHGATVRCVTKGGMGDPGDGDRVARGSEEPGGEVPANLVVSGADRGGGAGGV